MLLVLLLALALAGCLAAVPPLEPVRAGEPLHPVWVVDHGWHTSLVIQAADVPAGVWPERADVGGSRYLEVAWGDRDFYTAPDGSLGLALRAAVVSRGSVVHLVGFSAPVAQYFGGQDVIRLGVSRPGLQALARFIDAAHARGDAARAARLAPPLYGAGGFYPATGRYHLLNTCNTWVATALRTAGVPLAGLRPLTADGVLRAVRPLAPPAL